MIDKNPVLAKHLRHLVDAAAVHGALTYRTIRYYITEAVTHRMCSQLFLSCINLCMLYSSWKFNVCHEQELGRYILQFAIQLRIFST